MTIFGVPYADDDGYFVGAPVVSRGTTLTSLAKGTSPRKTGKAVGKAGTPRERLERRKKASLTFQKDSQLQREGARSRLRLGAPLPGSALLRTSCSR